MDAKNQPRQLVERERRRQRELDADRKRRHHGRHKLEPEAAPTELEPESAGVTLPDVEAAPTELEPESAGVTLPDVDELDKLELPPPSAFAPTLVPDEEEP